jgi:glutamine amidotransferase
MITIIDYGMGNLGSIQNMLKKIGVQSQITNDIGVINEATKIILPGVGAFDKAMNNLNDLNLIDVLNTKALKDKTPILGICLGMQLLTNSSEEGIKRGLGWIDGQVLKFKLDSSFKVPHMGWNSVNLQRKTQIFKNMYPDPRFYFVHSYYFQCNNTEDILTTTEYGINFVSSVNKGNIFGTQFHPEKSHKFGMKLLENFAKI